jgi:ribose 5-phosphate isomerase A
MAAREKDKDVAAQDGLKKETGRAGADMVKDGDIVGLGTGSTARFAIERLGERVAEGLRIRGIPTSFESERLARKCRIPLMALDEAGTIDITIDGADEVDPRLDLIKGMGGALLREKIVASATRKQVIVVDGSKIVERLGTKAPVPVEVIPFGHAISARRLAALGCVPALRKAKDSNSPFITDNANFIYDCRFDGIADARKLESEIDAIPGVVESGLFIGMAHVVITATDKGLDLRQRPVGK